MPRTARAALGGIVYHVLNRGNGRAEIFREPGDYQAFIELLIDAKDRAQSRTIRILPHAKPLAPDPAAAAR